MAPGHLGWDGGSIAALSGLTPDWSVERVRGRLDDRWSERLLGFWAANGALGEAEGRGRLPEVVCALTGPAGEIAGASSVYAADVPLVGGRRFWVFRSFVLPVAAGAVPGLIAATFAALEEEFDPAGGGPIGLCLLLGAAEAARRPEAEWTDPRMVHAGYLEDGRQVRIGYFTGAAIAPLAGSGRAPGGDLDRGPRIERFSEQDVVDARAVADFWIREGALDPAEAHRRVAEVLLVAVGGDGEIAGVTTAYLRHSARLRMPMWHFRGYVGVAHRRSMTGLRLGVRGREALSGDFTSGRDTRASGIVYEVENEDLKRAFPRAHWTTMDCLFIGENEYGDHVRVHYFPGARAPGPESAQGST